MCGKLSKNFERNFYKLIKIMPKKLRKRLENGKFTNSQNIDNETYNLHQNETKIVHNVTFENLSTDEINFLRRLKLILHILFYFILLVVVMTISILIGPFVTEQLKSFISKIFEYSNNGKSGY